MTRAIKLVAFVVTVVLLGRTLLATDLSSALHRAVDAGPALALAFLPFPLGLLLESMAWSRLLQRTGHRVSALRLLRVRFATEALTLALPSGGLVAEAASPLLLSGAAPASAVLASAAVKRLLIVQTHGVFVLVGVAIAYPALARAWPALPWLLCAGGVALLAASALLSRALTRTGIASHFRRVLERVRGSRLVPRSLRSRLALLDAIPVESLDQDLARFAGHRDAVASALLLGQWLMEAVGSFVLLRLLGVPIDFAKVLPIDGASTLIRALAAFAPAGLGAQDLGYLALFGAFGVAEVGVVGPAFVGAKRIRELAFVALGLTSLALHRSPVEAA